MSAGYYPAMPGNSRVGNEGRGKQTVRLDAADPKNPNYSKPMNEWSIYFRRARFAAVGKHGRYWMRTLFGTTPAIARQGTEAWLRGADDEIPTGWGIIRSRIVAMHE